TTCMMLLFSSSSVTIPLYGSSLQLQFFVHESKRMIAKSTVTQTKRVEIFILLILLIFSG
ncbi:MAG: hypothetical protein COZ08_03680, partial [Bacteroidetes bacterium CG_4_10_14_3_um_filter_42_6]